MPRQSVRRRPCACGSWSGQRTTTAGSTWRRLPGSRGSIRTRPRRSVAAQACANAGSRRDDCRRLKRWLTAGDGRSSRRRLRRRNLDPLMPDAVYFGPMFEQAFRNIDDILRKEAGCTTELDYTEQTSWLLFLKYLDG